MPRGTSFPPNGASRGATRITPTLFCLIRPVTVSLRFDSHYIVYTHLLCSNVSLLVPAKFIPFLVRVIPPHPPPPLKHTPKLPPPLCNAYASLLISSQQSVPFVLVIATIPPPPPPTPFRPSSPSFLQAWAPAPRAMPPRPRPAAPAYGVTAYV